MCPGLQEVFRVLDVVVLGPTPGAAGGIGVMAGYLASTSSNRTHVTFVDSGGSPGTKVGRLRAAAAAVRRCLARETGPTVYVLSVASNGSAWRKTVLSLLLRLRGKPYVLHLHGAGFVTFYRGLPGVLKRVVRSMFTSAAGVMVLGQVWADFVRSDLGVAPDRVRIVANAVPGPQRLPDRTGPVNVLFAGRVGSRKGVPELLQAWQQLNTAGQAQLLLAGDLEDPTGNIGRTLRATEDVELLGWVSPEDLTAQMACSSVLVLPSHAENLPLSLLEGMAWGLAPVVTPVGAVPEVISHDVNGLVAPVGDADALESALRRVVFDRPARIRTGAEARRTWEQSYSLTQYRPNFDDAVEVAFQKHARAREPMRCAVNPTRWFRAGRSGGKS